MSQPPKNPWPTINQRTIEYWDKMGRLNLWSGILGHEKMEHEVESHRKNREAEEAHVRKTVWGADDSENQEGEEMRQTVLGDINYPQPQPLQKKQSALPALALAAATLAVGGLGGYALSQIGSQPGQPQQQDTPAFDDSSVEIGLGRIEDYAKEGDQ